MALTRDEIQSTTQDFWIKKAHDNYFTGNILTYRLLKSGNKVSGGEKIRIPIWYGGPRGGVMGYNSTFDTTRYEAITSARFDWGIYYEPVTYGLKDKIENAGVAQEIDIVMTKMDFAQQSLKESMTTDLYGDGIAVGDTKPITGLFALLNATTSTAYGDIKQDDLSVWAPGATTTTTENLTLSVMRTLRRACKVGDSPENVPSLYITTDAIKDTYEGLLQPQVRFTDAKLANAGFDNLLFGNKPIVADMKCPAGYMFALNENYLDMKSHQHFFFHHEPWKQPTNQYLFTMQIMWAGNLVCTRRKAQGFHSNLS